MLLDFEVIYQQWMLVLLLLIGPLIFKFGMIALLSRALVPVQAFLLERVCA